MSKSNQQINKEQVVALNEADTPAVIAYRLAQVEKAVVDGFKAHDARLTELTTTFVVNADLKALDNRVHRLEITKSKDWVWKTLSAAAGAVLALLIIYAVTKK